MEFHEDGITVKRVEFCTYADFPSIIEVKPPVDTRIPYSKPGT